MVKKLFFASLIFTSILNSQEPNLLGSLLYIEVEADVETEPVFAGDDAADDMCVLENLINPEKSLIVSSDKKFGIIVYDLEGNKLYDYEVGRINNVDIIPSKFSQDKYLVAGTNRTHNSIDLYIFNSNGELEKNIVREVVPSLKDVYGITFYDDKYNTYLFVSDKKGNVEQWSYNNDESSPEIKFERKLIFKKNKFFKPDFEGLALRDDGDSKGYLISSVQGSNGYLLIDRESLKAKTFFRVISGKTIDGTTETDGIDVTSISTKKFPKGFFIAQDDDNDGLNQNFKLVDWRKIINEN